jgi:hypothetical protein
VIDARNIFPTFNHPIALFPAQGFYLPRRTGVCKSGINRPLSPLIIVTLLTANVAARLCQR